MKILLVDDDPDISSVIRMELEERNYEVDTASNGYAGNILATEKKYDAIILDVIIPGINGFELCKRIRKASKETIILMISSMDSYEDKVVGYLSGADGYLTKPFSFHELHSQINVQRQY